MIRPWTGAEIQVLREMYENHTRKEIASRLGRSAESVKSYALKVLRLRKGGVQRTLRGHFDRHTTVRPSDGCWEWQGRVNEQGYGTLVAAGRFWFAHRLSMFLHSGPIPVGLDVLHACDNPRCVRPDHLRLGTDHDNQIDRAARKPRILTADVVLRLRERFACGEDWRDMARAYPDAHPLTIRHAVTGRSWRWLPMPGTERRDPLIAPSAAQEPTP